MQRLTLTVLTAVLLLAGCSTAPKMPPERLASLGVTVGAQYWPAQQALAREDYRCFVTGAKREQFDCTKSVGFFPTCLLRIEYTVNDENLISHVRVADPACIGTP